MDNELAQVLGRVEGKQDLLIEETRLVHNKLDKHLSVPHADCDDVKMNTRWRWGLMGIIALLSAVGTILAFLP